MKLFKILGKLIAIILVIIIIIALAFLGYGYIISRQILSEKSIDDAVTEIRNKDTYVTIDQINPDFTNAIVAVEDRRFYMHKGFDPISFIRALYIDIKNQDFSQGGSTITQQLAKNIYFTNKQVLIRKVTELFIALDIEHSYSKNDILELYINNIYYGNNYYSLKEACEGYFNVSPLDLSLDQATMLAGIPNAPSAYSPTSNMVLAKKRQKHVINSMVNNGYLTELKAKPLLDNIDNYLKNNDK